MNDSIVFRENPEVEASPKKSPTVVLLHRSPLLGKVYITLHFKFMCPDLITSRPLIMKSNSIRLYGSDVRIRRRRTSIKRGTLFLILIGVFAERSQSFLFHVPQQLRSYPSLTSQCRRNDIERYICSQSPSTLFLGVSQSTSTNNNRNRRSSTDDSSSWEQRIRKAGRQGRTDEAIELYETLLRQSSSFLTIRHVNAAIDALARASPPRLEQALQLAQSSPCRVNVYTLGMLLNACARAGDAVTAQRWLRQANTLFARNPIAPNEVCYQACMTACVQANDFASCRKLFHEALEKGIPLTVIGYNIVVSAAAKQGDWQTAMAVVKQMQAPNSTTPAPDAVTYGTLLAACEAAGQWLQVLEQAQAMKNEGFDLDVRALSSCLHACQQLGRAEQALQLLEQMEALPATDTQVPDAVAYRLALSACARGGKLAEGLRLLEKLETHFPHEEANVVAYTAAIAGCESEGQWKVAFRLVDRMRKRGVQPNEMTFVAVLAACATACARQASTLASKTSTDVSAPKDITSSEPYQQAMKLLRVLKKDTTVVNPNIHVYNVALRVCAEACDLKGAFALYNELIEDRDSSANIPEGTVTLAPNIVTFGTLMTACERVGSMEGVTQVFRWMQDLSGPPIKPNEIVYGAALSACRRAQNDERSFFLFEQMLQNPKLRPNVATYNTVLLAQTEAGTKTSTARALSVFRSLYNSPYTQPNRQSYQIIIRALALDRRPLEALTLLQQMQQAGFRPDVDLYTCTVAAFEKTGQPAQALKLMEAMRADGYDFYSNGVLDAAFKQGVQIVSSVQRGLETKKMPKSLDAGLGAPRSFNETIAQWIAPSME